MIHLGFNRLACGVSLALFAAMTAPAAVAQDAQPAPAEAAQPPGVWQKQCQSDPKTNQQTCIVVQITPLSRDVIPSVSIRQIAEKKYAIGVLVPMGVQLPPGVVLAIDGEKKATAPFRTCEIPSQDFPFPVPSCTAEAEVDEAFIASMRKGNELDLVVVDRRNQARPIPLTLIGFAKIFDGPGVDPATAQKQRDDRIRQLNDDNRKTLVDKLKQLQDQQGGG